MNIRQDCLKIRWYLEISDENRVTFLYFMHKFINLHISRDYSDKEIVTGLQTRERQIEEWFYKCAKTYFMDKFNDVFFDKEQKDSIFQDSFVRLWTQIEDHTIFVKEDKIWRLQRNGLAQPMTCSLNTFLFAIAKNEYREFVRSNKIVFVEDYFDKAENNCIELPKMEEDEKDVKNRIIDECIQMMPPRCLDILTLFYIKGKSLDEILEIRKDKNTSKVGLKSAKYKCMNALRERVIQMFDQLNIKI